MNSCAPLTSVVASNSAAWIASSKLTALSPRAGFAEGNPFKRGLRRPATKSFPPFEGHAANLPCALIAIATAISDTGLASSFLPTMFAANTFARPAG